MAPLIPDLAECNRVVWGWGPPFAPAVERWPWSVGRLQDGLDPPVAAVTRFLDTGERDGGWYLRADPVHLRADLNKLILFDASTFALSDREARSFAADCWGTW